MADEVASVVMVGKSAASTKAKPTFPEEKTERIISLGSKKEVLFDSLHIKDYFKNDAIKLVFKPPLLQQLPVTLPPSPLTPAAQFSSIPFPTYTSFTFLFFLLLQIITTMNAAETCWTWPFCLLLSPVLQSGIRDTQKDGATHCILGRTTCRPQIYCVYLPYE